MIHGDALKKLWTGICDVYVKEQVNNTLNGVTEFKEVLKIKGQPCRLSFSSNKIAEQSGATGISQSIKLFIDNSLNIPAGSKIVVTQNQRTEVYSQSAPPAVYSTHQEIELKLFERWA